MKQENFQYSRYVDKMHLTAADLENQRAYDSEKRLLLNKTLVGCGVLYGLQAWNVPGTNSILIQSGFAMDTCGHELFLHKELLQSLQELCKEDSPKPGLWWLYARYMERPCGAGEVLQPDGTIITEPNRVAEEVTFVAVQELQEDGVLLARLLVRTQEDGGAKLEEVIPISSRPGGLGMGNGDSGESAGGVLWIDCTGESRRVRFSQEIEHGLGTGEVFIELGVQGWAGGRRCVISGDLELFRLGVRLAAQVFPTSGTFVAAAYMTDGWRCERLAVRWLARRCVAPPVFGSMPPQDTWGQDFQAMPGAPSEIRLEPGVALLAPGEQIAFVPQDAGGQLIKQNFRFFADAGFIDEMGNYTAPAEEGLYTVTAIAGENAEHPLSALALVRRR